MTAVQENTPDLMPLKARYLGWQQSFRKRTKLLEPEITENPARRSEGEIRAAYADDAAALDLEP